MGLFFRGILLLFFCSFAFQSGDSLDWEVKREDGKILPLSKRNPCPKKVETENLLQEKKRLYTDKPVN